MKRWIKITTAFLTAACILTGYSGLSEIHFANAAEKVKAPENLLAVKKSTTAIRLSWKKASGVSGYRIYRWDKKKKKYKKIKTISKRSTVKWTNRGLKKNHIYTYRIRAYKKSGKKKIWSKRSYKVTAKTYSKKAKKVNAVAVEIANDLTNVSVGFYDKLIETIYSSKKEGFDSLLAINENAYWYSSNPEIAEITSKGKLKVKKTGSCYIYARAHNGIKTRTRLKAGIYTRPKTFVHLNELSLKARQVLESYHGTMADIIDYLEPKVKKKRSIYLKNGQVTVSPSLNLGNKSEMIRKFLADSKVAIIQYDGGNVYFKMEKDNNAAGIISYDASGDNNDESDAIKLASHWYYDNEEFVNAIKY